MDDILNFLPIYPDINDDDFNTLIYSKKEFYENKLDKNEYVDKTKKREFLKHQILISRFLSSNTLYDEMLLYHEMGTGKTCSSIAAIEQIRKENNNFKGCLVLTRSPMLLNNYKRELILECTQGKYITDIKYKNNKIDTSLIDDFYKFHTYQTFARKIKIQNKIEIKGDVIEDYSNYIIVMDEIQNLRNLKVKKKKDRTTYKILNLFLHLIQNRKIILLSGTPIKDKIDEIVDDMNLILPNDQMMNKEDFIKKYFETVSMTKNKYLLKNINLYKLNENNVSELKSKFKGRISFLKAMRQENVYKKFIGKSVGGLSKFIVYDVQMSKFQRDVYLNVFNNESKKDEINPIYINSRETSLFVFPDGSYGKDGFKKYIKHINNNYSLHNDISKVIKNKDYNKMLENIGKYSCKYMETIRDILKNVNKKSMFFYSNIVNGGGTILFSLLLELFGFEKATGNEKTKKLRYIILLSTNRTQFQKLIERFNNEDNKYGEYISIIIGSKAISEGFSFKNIQVEYILTPHWNYTETDQAIARGYRYGSHDHLLKDNNENIELQIFQYAAIPDNRYEMSIDIQMYKTSEIKDMNMKLVERVIKESAIDCALNYDRNFVEGYDNQRDCEYRECDYECDNVLPRDIDYSTDKIFYINSISNKLILNSILDLFKKKFYIDAQDIFNENKNEDIEYIIIFLHQLIDNKVIIYNKYNIPCYLNEKNNIYFLSDNIYLNNDNYLSNYYLINPNIKVQNSFKTVVNNLEIDLIPTIISKFSNNLEKFINKFNMETKELLLEYSIIALIKDKKTKVRDFILDYFKYFYKKIDTTWYIWLLYDDKLKNYNSIKCLDENYEWNSCNNKQINTYTDVKNKELKKITRNSYGFHARYGKFDNKTGKNIFVLIKNEVEKEITDKKIDTRLLFKGQDCKSYDKSELIKIILDNFKIKNMSDIKDCITPIDDNDELDIKVLEKFKKEELCCIIKNFLESKNLIIN
jgi:hypothetical protein